jgi:hypothetical protein
MLFDPVAQENDRDEILQKFTHKNQTQITNFTPTAEETNRTQAY